MALRTSKTLKDKKQNITATSKSEFVAQAPLTVKKTNNKKVIKSIYFTQNELDLIEDFKSNTSISRNKLGSEAIA